MRTKYCWVIIAVIFSFSGCQLGTRVQGEYYLTQEKYKEGVEKFGARLQKNSFDPAANYYMGRYLLALDRPQEALPYLNLALNKLQRYPDEIVAWKEYLSYSFGRKVGNSGC